MNRASYEDLLIRRIEAVLGSGMGADLFRRWPGGTSTRVMLEWLVLYGLTWAAIASFLPGSGRPQLVSLLAWGGFYFAGAVYAAQTATDIILVTVKRDVIAHASKGYLFKAAKMLRKRYSKGWQHRLPLLAALVALALAVVAISVDLMLPAAEQLSAEFLFWAATYFLFFYTAALSVAASRFYLAFADLLEEESGSFYVWGAADSPLVKGLATLATQVLVFMAIICVLLASGMLLAILPWQDYALGLDSWLLLLMVPASCFFSLGYGSLVYLQAEAKIRSVLRRFTIRQAALLQKSDKLVRPGKALSPDKAEEVERLAGLHDRILAGGRYGSRLGTAVSIALPLIIPIISLIFQLARGGR